MKKNYYPIVSILALLLILISASKPVLANSPNPTIINGNVILCPGGQETLITQEYDTYQWYKNGNLIPGATQQTHVITYFQDLGSNFSVFVTQGAQSAMSPSIFVDGYMFLPLVVSSYGQGYWFTGDGWEMCEYHELFFEVMSPYNTNIQWYRNGMPIPGANSSIFQVDQTGAYTVSGAPAICPDYVQYSLPLPVIVHVPPTPIITQSSDTLFTSVFPGQWYFGENPLPGATGQFLVPETVGWYSFEFTDENACKKMSEPYYFEFPVALVPGDSNCDGIVNVLDVLTTINYILGNNPQPFCFDNADVNADGTLDVIDVIGTVDIVLSGSFICGVSTVTDVDGNVYNTVLIGNQCWMKENLKTTQYRNSTPIEYPGTDDNAWANNTTGAYAWYDNDISWKESYGALYNWHAVNNTNGLCPTGWHVPSDAEWTQLVDYVVAQGFLNSNVTNGAGNALKSCRQVNSPLDGECNTTEHTRWNSHSTHHGFDEFGFSALPGGNRVTYGYFVSIGDHGYWWSSTEYSSTLAWFRNMGLNRGNVSRSNDGKTGGFSVRCLRDNVRTGD
jgi:uncharacterized protein (TIGR02145 family)